MEEQKPNSQSEEQKYNEKYSKAKKRVEELRGFYSHAITYVAVNVALFVIWLLTSGFGTYPWFFWVLGWWGFGLFWHAMGMFVFSKVGTGNWEQKKIKEIMDKMDEK